MRTISPQGALSQQLHELLAGAVSPCRFSLLLCPLGTCSLSLCGSQRRCHSLGTRGNSLRPVLGGRFPVLPDPATPLGQPEPYAWEGWGQPGKQKPGLWPAACPRQLGCCKRARASADRNGAWVNKAGIELNRVRVRVNRDGVCKQGCSLCKQGCSLHKQGKD